MTSEQQQVKDWMLAFGQECPEKPTIPTAKNRILRVKLMYEELIKELSLALGVGIYLRNEDGEWDMLQDIEDINFCDLWDEDGPSIDSEKQQQLQEILDGCEDLKVVTEGTLLACGLVKPSPQIQRWRQEGDQYGSYSVPYCVTDNSDEAFNEVMRSNWTKLWTKMEVDKYRASLTVEAGAGLSVTFIPYTGSDKQFLVKDATGKVLKSPSYSPANLAPFIQ